MAKDNAPILKRGSLMSGADLLSAQQPQPPPEEGRPPLPAALPSGRQVALSMEGGTELLEVVAPDGNVEVRIELTESGPVVRLSGARLELSATETVRLDAKNIEVNATEAIAMSCTEDMRLKSTKDVFVEGSVIWLN